ncbi:hypothetical protein ACU686_23825 [Yinghuangia aomiensis]
MTGPAADPAATPTTGPASEPPAPAASEGAAAPRPPRPPWQRVLARLMVVARPVLLVLAVGGIVYIVLGNWDEVAKTLDELPWYSVACSGFVLLVGMFVGTLSWQQLVDGMGKPIGVLKGAQIQLVSQLGKYVPGSVWTYVLQLELGRKAQVSRARIFTASLLYVIISVVTALLLGVLALPVVLKDAPGAAWAFLLLPIGFAGLHPKVLARTGEFTLRLLKRPPVKLRLTWGLVGRSAGLASFAYVLFGVHLWILARGVAPADLQQLLPVHRRHRGRPDRGRVRVRAAVRRRRPRDRPRRGAGHDDAARPGRRARAGVANPLHRRRPGVGGHRGAARPARPQGPGGPRGDRPRRRHRAQGHPRRPRARAARRP